MTLVVAANSRESIWLVADRRLSSDGKVVRDDARKIMFLETSDGVAILGYAGLGATALGTEPADWMSNILRGRNMPLEKSLGILADAMKREFPRHLVKMTHPGRPSHNIVITAFHNNEPKVYTIDLEISDDRKQYRFRYTRQLMKASENDSRTWDPRIIVAGSGGLYLWGKKNWARPLLRILSRYDKGEFSREAVAEHLAGLNNSVSESIHDNSVGNKCIIACRNRKTGFYKGGGNHYYYTGTKRDKGTPALPSITMGMDMRAIANMLMPITQENMDTMLKGEKPKKTKEEINEELRKETAKLPNFPDEKLP